MIYENEKHNLCIITALLEKSGLVNSREFAEIRITPMSGDGSSRRFWRIKLNRRAVCLAVAPPDLAAKNMDEARAARLIGTHLHEQGVNVPEQYGWDADSGLILFEDFGDCKLHDLVKDCTSSSNDIDLSRIRPLYRDSVQKLARMQIAGSENFNPAWCWDTSVYDKAVMLERESGYFLRACWLDLLQEKEPQGLQEEFVLLADKAAEAQADYFLHRDFQSRNIMIHGEQVRFIDFQGGRLGPLGYDLASLLIDPYTGLPEDFRDELFEMYCDAVDRLAEFDRQQFRQEYMILALQRNLQIAGAFSFLSEVLKKTFFRQFIHPALLSLQVIVSDPLFDEFQVLKKTVFAASSRF